MVLSACGSSAQISSTVRPSSALTTPGASPGSKPTTAGSTTIIDQAGPPPVILQDTSPDQLAAQVHLTIGGYDPATQNLAELSIVFLHQGHWAQFVRGERLSCNGITLQGAGTTFDLQVPAETIGADCLHLHVWSEVGHPRFHSAADPDHPVASRRVPDRSEPRDTGPLPGGRPEHHGLHHRPRTGDQKLGISIWRSADPPDGKPADPGHARHERPIGWFRIDHPLAVLRTCGYTWSWVSACRREWRWCPGDSRHVVLTDGSLPAPRSEPCQDKRELRLLTLSAGGITLLMRGRGFRGQR